MIINPKNILLFLFLGIFGSVTYSQNSEIKPNIVLILVDDAALMDFGAYSKSSFIKSFIRLVSNCICI
jgi:hypothetical protein